jgi:HTH-type transcriptional regulator, sugar sensing transcriptional regulator
MTSQEKILQTIGLSPGESKVYLSLIKLGQVSSGQIIKNTTVSRSKIYEILDRLHTKGLVSKITKESKTLYLAQPPQKIKQLLTNKEKEIAKQQEIIDNILPTLTKIYQNKTPKNSTEVFTGDKGVISALNNLLDKQEKNEEYFVFSIVDVPEKFEKHLNNLYKRLTKGNTKIRIIFSKKVQKEIVQKYSNKKLIQARSLPKEFSSPTVFNIYKNKTAIIVWATEPIAILIKNQEIANSFKNYFEIIWNAAT